MPKYISLLRFTDKGARAIEDSPKRAREFAKAVTKAGARVEGQYWTTGAYDGVLIISADKPAQALHCLIELASDGNVRTETMQLFEGKEFDAIVGE